MKIPTTTLRTLAVLGWMACMGMSHLRAADDTWPDALLIDDFSDGLSQWESRGVGTLTVGEGAQPGQKALVWTADRDGLGHIVLRNLERKKIDFSQYDLLVMSLKFEGKPIWSLNPILQQWPAVFGYRGLYWSLSTLAPFDRWFTLAQDLHLWGNAWPDSFNPAAQEFELEIHQLAGPGKTRINIGKVWLVKNPLNVPLSVAGDWQLLPEGGQATSFEIPVQNHGNKTVTLTAVWDGAAIEGAEYSLPDQEISLAPGQEGRLSARITLPAPLLSQKPAFFGVVRRLALRVKEIPELVRFVELSAGSQPRQPTHPAILTTPHKMEALQKTYNDPARRSELGKGMLALVAQAEKALTNKPQYPPNAATGRKTDPVSGGILRQLEVPDLPFHVYQDPKSGRTYSGPLYDAGVLGWLDQHMKNAATAKSLALGYLITGRQDMAQASAQILRDYLTRYLQLPFIAYEPGSPAGNRVSGTTRIGGTFMRERVWLTNLALALDSIRSSGVFKDSEIAEIRHKIFEPSAQGMMDHKVGVMNLQWMIQSAALYAGLASDAPSLVARAIDDSHGIRRLMETGFLPDGQWWENDSYQNVTKLAAYPALATAIFNGILPWDEGLSRIFTAAYRLYGPDTHGPTLGTGGWADFTLDDEAITAFAGITKSPELAWIAYHRPGGKAINTDIGLMAMFRQAPPLIPESATRSPIPEGSVNFPDYGGIALRVPGTDQYCYFHYGRELVHGHRNKLSINAYGSGGWYARNVMGGYEHHFKEFLETIASANTIVVDGANPDADTGELTFHRSAPRVEMASGRTRGAYQGVEHERSIVLTRHGLVVLDRCLSAEKRVYDWLWHGSHTGLQLLTPTFDTHQAADIGDSPLYQSLKILGSLPTPQNLIWSRKNNSGLVQAFLPEGKFFLLHNDQAVQPHESLLWRQTGSTVRFAAVMNPYDADAKKPTVALRELKVTDAAGKPVSLEQAQAVEVRYPDETLTVLVNYSGQVLRSGPVSSSERVSVHLSERATSTDAKH